MANKSKPKKQAGLKKDIGINGHKAMKKIIAESDDKKNIVQSTKRVIVEKEEDTPKQRKFSAHRIADIYRNAAGRSVDMKKIEKRDPSRRRRIVGWIIFVLIILLGVSVGGFYFFVNRQGEFTKENINIEVRSLSITASGDEISYLIKVTNNEEVDLTNLELTAQFPQGFTFKSSVPDSLNEARNAWSLPQIKKGATEKVVITGQLFGDIGSIKIVHFTLSYMPSNFSSEFQNKASHSVTITSSILDLELDVPIRLISDKESVFTISYKNNSENDIDKVRVEAILPEDMSIASYEPEAKEKNNIWEIDRLGGKESGEIKIRGSFSGTEGEMREMKFTIGYLDENNEFHLQTEKSALILIINPELELTLSINESESNNTASFGGTLDYAINYVNNSQSEIRDIIVTAELISKVLDWDSLVDANDGLVNDDKIIWDKLKIPSFELLEPGDEGELQFSIEVKNNILARDDDDKNYSIVSSVKAQSSDVVDLEDSVLEIESNSITTKLNSRLDLTAEGRYYDDEYIPVGSGPLPPEVEKTTIYRIYWGLTNTSNEVHNVVVTTTLPDDVIWTGRSSVSAGNSLAFNPTTRVATWQINRIPVHTGQLTAGLEAYFDVAVTPTSDDIGKLIILTNKHQLFADDTFTKEKLTQTHDIITSELATDPLGAGKGLVIEAGATNTNSNTNN